MTSDQNAFPSKASLFASFERFARSEAAGGIVMLIFTAAALVWANSPWNDSYMSALHHSVRIGGHQILLDLSVHEWINDGLMTLFFFLVGLEIKREMLVGELASLRRAALPVAGAIGGMVVPAIIYAAINAGGVGARGWGIPMATDIAFALTVVALLGSRVPPALKVFLVAVAIVDDIGAVLVIAIFYTASISWMSLVIAGSILAALIGLNAAGVRRPAPYALLGVLLWAAVLSSGVHATIAGVILAMTIPSRAVTPNEKPLLERFEHALHYPVAFLVVPLFALANAGVRIGNSTEVHAAAITSGVIVGLVLGKPLGITAVSWLAVRSGIASLPDNVSWRLVQGVSWLGGIGFTMSLFVGALAFPNVALLDTAKIGVLIASGSAALMGWLMLHLASVRQRRAA